MTTLFSFPDANQYIVHFINLIQTDGCRKGTEIRKRKNEIIDSVLIAGLIRYGSFGESVLSEEPLTELKQLALYRAYLKGTASDFKRKIIAIIDKLFPEYESVFQKLEYSGKPQYQHKCYINYHLLSQLMLSPQKNRRNIYLNIVVAAYG